MDLSEWITQVRRGILEYCILSLVAQKPRYGYEIASILQQWEPLAITEGTLYPLLRRLSKEKYITSTWQESSSGPPRKYYYLTESGKDLLEQMNREWNRLIHGVTEIRQLKGEQNDGAKCEDIS
ncbi:PadR family transcriptional regulator [Thermoflavimicrobium dichotomicum]|uniref:PadR family transcriptional regulator, regulatory protein PadR n=1 Tax=Thermoflavimicrobium dichotomicum TaxID=46223 RepID=A0A1I3MHP4_9BACL|nr:PadR family transcriptional regulator [Thermoflavimicrobium dichotomicum]SFI96421.1 PadR family transcriptional regulator, regulatory protein PadR [Thermoflavimicrobium dichotomicum]